ncbi:LamG-like jellyroll fold domain-containing protein [Nanoarchaeota archaeon]
MYAKTAYRFEEDDFTDGADHYSIPSGDWTFAGDFAISYWIKFDSFNDYQNVLSTTSDAGANNGWWTEFGFARGFTMLSNTVLILEDDITDLSDLDVNKWYHIVITRSGSTLEGFINNVKFGQNTYGSTIGDNTNSLLIGKYAASESGYSFDGTIDELVVWNRSLSFQEITDIHKRQKSNYVPDGTYTSKIFNAAFNSQWRNITWDELPWYMNQPLPDNKQDERATQSNGANMSGNVVLLHFNEGNVTNGSTVVDYSGEGNNVTAYLNSTSQSATVDGRFSNGVYFDGLDDFFNDSLPAYDVKTISFWLKTPAVVNSATSCQYLLSLRQTGAADYFYVGLGDCTALVSSEVITVLHDDPNGRTGATGLTITEDEWHQITIVWDGSGKYDIYLDGEEKFTSNGGTEAALLTDSNLFRLGSYVTGVADFNGTIDELAIWTRSLSEAEIIDNFQRGALRLSVDVRACDDSICDTEIFGGNYENSTSSTISGQYGQYFQYKVNFLTDSLNLTPELLTHSVTVSYEAESTPPVVTLNNFNNDSIDLQSQLDFNCSATNVQLTNATLYHNLDGTWSSDGSTSMTGTADSVMWSRNLSDIIGTNSFVDTSFDWNCYVCDANANCAWATENGTFSGWDLGNYNKSELNSTALFLTEDDTEQELPNDNGNDGWINMTGNVLLLHFNNDSNYGESNTHVYDFSGIGNNGTVIGGNVTAANGILDRKMQFDGSSDYVNTGTMGSFGSTIASSTVSVWMKSTDTSGQSAIFKVIDDPNNNPGIEDVVYAIEPNRRINSGCSISNVGGSTLFYIRGEDGDALGAYITTDIYDGEWHHIAWRLIDATANSMEIYVDGVTQSFAESCTAGPSGFDNWVDDLFVGAQNNRGNSVDLYFDGDLDEVAIWNRTLSVEEIVNIYNRQKGNYIDRGKYISKIFDATTNANWNNISWDVPFYYYGQELPDNRAVESLAGGVNMTGNILLLHLNNESAYGENGTLFYDFSGTGNNGSGRNFEGDEITAEGFFNGAVDFDGSDDTIRIEDDPSLREMNEVSVSAWFKEDSSPTGTDIHTVVAKATYNVAAEHSYFIRIRGTGSAGQQIRWQASDASTTCNADYATLPTPGKWHHIVGVYNDTHCVLYLNGVEISSTAQSLGIINDSGTALKIADSAAADDNFPGIIDEVAIWNRSLSVEEITNLYKRGVIRLNLSARACDDAVCDTETFDETVDNANYSALSGLTGQYFQYGVNYDALDTNFTPELLTNSVTMGYEEIAATVTLNTPTDLNYSVDLQENITINCSAIGNNLANISLYADFNETWEVINTTTISGSSGELIYDLDLSEYWGNNTIKDTSYKWNCLAIASGGSDWGDSNYTFGSWDLGTYENTTRNPTNISLIANSTGQYPNTTGYYTSQIFDAGLLAYWPNISWDLGYDCSIDRLFDSELPSGQNESDWINMSDNILLLHLNDEITDSSGGDNTGEIVGGSYTSGSRVGDYAIHLDGYDDYFYIDADPFLDSYSSRTVMLWFKMDGDNSWYIPPDYPDYYTLVSKHAGTSSSDAPYHINIWAKPPNRGKINVRSADAPWPDYRYYSQTGTSLVNDGEWHHVASVFNDDTNRLLLYVDGNVESNVSVPSDWQPIVRTHSGVYVGHWLAYSPDRFYGSVDEVAILNRALSSEEIETVYETQNSTAFRDCQTTMSVRSCDNETCSDSNFTGSYTVETLAEFQKFGNYFQYNLTFSTQNVSLSPELIDSVRIGVMDAQDTVEFNIWDSTDSSPAYSNYTNVEFYATWKRFGQTINTSDGICKILINESPYINTTSWINMTYTGGGYFVYNQPFQYHDDFSYTINCTSGSDSSQDNNTFTILSPIRFVFRSISVYPDRKYEVISAQVINSIDSPLNYVRGEVENVPSDMIAGFLGTLDPGILLNVSHNVSALVSKIGVTLDQAHDINYTFNLTLKSNETSQELDRIPVYIYLPEYSGYDFNVTPASKTFTINDKTNSTQICADTSFTVQVTNNGTEYIGDLNVSVDDNFMSILKPQINNYILPVNESINITIYANITEDTSAKTSNLTISILGGNITKTVTMTYNAGFGSGWASIPDIPAGRYITPVAISYLGINHGSQTRSIALPVSTADVVSAELELRYNEICQSQQSYNSFVYVNDNLDYQSSGITYRRYTPDINTSHLLTGINEIYSNTSGYDSLGHYCVNQQSYFKLNIDTASTGRYCNVLCSPTEVLESNFTDRVDNDCDGFIDCADDNSCGDTTCNAAGDWQHEAVCPTRENCTNEIDDDGDGMIDCEDVAFCCANSACNTSYACDNVEADPLCDYGNYDTLCVLTQGITFSDMNSSPMSLRYLELQNDTYYITGTLDINATGDVDIQSGVTIDGDGRGYASGSGPGVGGSNSGGSYGGRGGGDNKGNFYGSALVPDFMGSGGGGRDGGGLVQLTCDYLINYGEINVDGEDGDSGSGAGGGIFINASAVDGSGTYTAKGGGTGANHGAGSGGRIAIHADDLSALSNGLFDITGGNSAWPGFEGKNGTVVWYDKDDNDLYLVNEFKFQGNETPNGTDFVGQQNYRKVFFENVIAYAYTSLDFNVTDWVMDDNSSLTGFRRTGYDLNITASDFVNLSNTGLSQLRINALVVNVISSGLVSGIGRGYDNDSGPGAGGQYEGGGYGGRGGRSGGAYYGSAFIPDDMGSGGDTGEGGGLFVVNAENITNYGTIDVSGIDAGGATGAGGGIFINVTNIFGNGNYSAKGGLMYGEVSQGGGGGGRIAIHADNLSVLNIDNFNISGGPSAAYDKPGDIGTLVWYDKDDDTLYAKTAYRFEEDDFTDGQIRVGSIEAEDVTLQLETNTTFNLTSQFLIKDSTFEGSNKKVKIITPVINFTNSSVDVSEILDLVYSNAFYDDEITTYPASIFNLRIERVNNGSINWTNNVTNVHNLSDHVSIVGDTVTVNSSAVSGLNTTADIVLYTGRTLQPVVIRDLEDDGTFEVCPSNVCNITDFNPSTGRVIFTVTRFTSYKAGNNSELTIWDDTDPEGGSNTKYVGDNVGFYANYTNLTSGAFIEEANCTISIEGIVSNANMSFNNSGTNLYEYNTSAFASNGTFDWNVTCNHSLHDTLTANDTVNISLGTIPTVMLNLPVTNNNSIDLTQTTTFNCSANNTNLRNITFYHNFNGAWVANTTINISGSSGSGAWSINPSEYWNENTIIDTSYYWNCRVFDAGGQESWASSNATFSGWNRGTHNKTELNATGLFLTENDTEQELPNNGENDGWINMTGNVLLMHMNEASATNGTIIEDTSGAGNNGTVNLNSTLGNLTVSGKLNGALELDGVDDRIELPDNSFNSLSGGTVSMWINLNSPLDQGRIFGVGRNEPGNNNYTMMDITLDGNLRVYSKSNNIEQYWIIGTGRQASANQWHHVVWTKTGTTHNLYLDGTNLTLDTIVSTNLDYHFDDIGPPTRYTIGMLGRGDYLLPVNGSIDEVAIWNRSLSAAEIKNMYDRQKGKYIDRGIYTSKVFDTGQYSSFHNLTYDVPHYFLHWYQLWSFH